MDFMMGSLDTIWEDSKGEQNKLEKKELIPTNSVTEQKASRQQTGSSRVRTLASFSSAPPSFCRQNCNATYTFSCNFCIFSTSVSQARSAGNQSDKIVSLVFWKKTTVSNVNETKKKTARKNTGEIK